MKPLGSGAIGYFSFGLSFGVSSWIRLELSRFQPKIFRDWTSRLKILFVLPSSSDRLAERELQSRKITKLPSSPMVPST